MSEAQKQLEKLQAVERDDRVANRVAAKSGVAAETEASVSQLGGLCDPRRGELSVHPNGGPPIPKSWRVLCTAVGGIAGNGTAQNFGFELLGKFSCAIILRLANELQ